jgi:hypothetical protein
MPANRTAYIAIFFVMLILALLSGHHLAYVLLYAALMLAAISIVLFFLRRRIYEAFPKNPAISGEAGNSAENGYADFPELKKYMPGDDCKKIHWSLSAKRGELISKNFAAQIIPETQMPQNPDKPGKKKSPADKKEKPGKSKKIADRLFYLFCGSIFAWGIGCGVLGRIYPGTHCVEIFAYVFIFMLALGLMFYNRYTTAALLSIIAFALFLFLCSIFHEPKLAQNVLDHINKFVLYITGYGEYVPGYETSVTVFLCGIISLYTFVSISVPRAGFYALAGLAAGI